MSVCLFCKKSKMKISVSLEISVIFIRKIVMLCIASRLLFCCLLFLKNSFIFYQPVAIIKKLVQLLLHFHWLRSPWWQSDIFRYAPSSRKMVILFVNISKWENRKPLQGSNCKVFFLYLQLLPICISWELKQFSFSLVSF